MEGQAPPARALALAGGDPVLFQRDAGTRDRDQKLPDRLSQHPLGSHLPPVREQPRHARPDALAITEDDMDKLLLTPTEAAAALGIGRSKVYELMQTGQLPSVHIGACRRVPAEALHAFLERLRTAS